MKYDKPQLFISELAIESIQSSTRKIQHIVIESQNWLATTAAYEADE